MKRFSLLLAGFALAGSLIACQSNDDDKNTQAKVDDGNQKISRLNDLTRSLASRGVYLSTSILGTDLPDGLSDSELQSIRDDLNEFVSKGNDVLGLEGQKNVIWTDGAKMRSLISRANSYLGQIDGYRDRQARRSNFGLDKRAAGSILSDKALDTIKPAVLQ